MLSSKKIVILFVLVLVFGMTLILVARSEIDKNQPEPTLPVCTDMNHVFVDLDTDGDEDFLVTGCAYFNEWQMTPADPEPIQEAVPEPTQEVVAEPTQELKK